ncbi:4'-phosphopantetheinyl transferase family protein [Streptomyces agglomeratus]|uniref:4'-phosphopantetheinyl transferase family protein n=2 Tax=Streptomyces agglomeratus TaxID=285458 RepID=UPI00210A0893|nr:4'-phosphopantetheinyl transferase superfamily protein [Streptomyces agglomeratus]
MFVLRRILPSCIAVAESRDDLPEGWLYPEEAALISTAVDSRRREFTTARHCARRAMRELGLRAVPVLPGRHGAPRWPSQAVGSLTHCAGYRGAALARVGDIAMLGVDAEPHGPLPDRILEAIALPRERRQVEACLARYRDVRWDRLLFSAKESVYKAWNPYTGQRLEFEDADIDIDPDAMTFTARLLAPRPDLPAGVPPAPGRLEGRWLVSEGVVLTAIAVPAPL